jgi:hypothetical protein
MEIINICSILLLLLLIVGCQDIDSDSVTVGGNTLSTCYLDDVSVDRFFCMDSIETYSSIDGSNCKCHTCQEDFLVYDEYQERYVIDPCCITTDV